MILVPKREITSSVMDTELLLEQVLEKECGHLN
jgi:hypothetical protein